MKIVAIIIWGFAIAAEAGFSVGDTVAVRGTGTAGLKAWQSTCSGTYVTMPEHTIGVVKAGPVLCSGYQRYQVRYAGQSSDLWSAEDWLVKVLPAPVPSDPANGATGVGLTSEYDWSSINGATRYWLTASTSSADLPVDPSATSCAACLTKGGISVVTDVSGFIYGDELQGTANELKPATKYYWRVQAYNSTYDGAYSAIQSFTTAAACSYTISSASRNFAQSGGAGSFSIAAGSGCSWSASDNASWIHTSSSGAGNGTISYSVDANSGAARAGIITVGGKTFSISQDGVSQPTTLAGIKIGIDPGHGGVHTGSAGPYGIVEKNVNLATSLALRNYLAAHGASVVMTRTTDTQLDLNPTNDLIARGNFMVSQDVDLSISVHHDGNANSAINYVTAFIYCTAPLAWDGLMAAEIVGSLSDESGVPLAAFPASYTSVLCPGKTEWSSGIPGVGVANLGMVRIPRLAGIPAVLVEVSFVSNPTEAMRLSDPDQLDSDGWAIYAGIARTYGVNPLPRSGSSDNAAPTISAFNVSPKTNVLGQAVSIGYTVSDSGGSGLNRIELWRASDNAGQPDAATWVQVGNSYTLSGNGPISGTLIDTPSVLGRFWYGCHVVDNVGNLSDEADFNKGPLSVHVVSGLRLLVPNGDEAWPVGSVQSISWNPGSLEGNVRIQLAYNDNPQLPDIVSSTANDGAFNWTVPSGLYLGNAYNILITSLSGGGVDFSDGPFSITAPQDIQPPAISILSPTSAGAFSTTQSSLRIGGVASDNAELKKITWRNDRGGEGVASGGESWAFDLGLAEGLNSITVVATDVAGNESSDSIAITYAIPPPSCEATQVSPVNEAVLRNAPVEFSWEFNGPCGHKILLTTNVLLGAIASFPPTFGEGEQTYLPSAMVWSNTISSIGEAQKYFWAIGSSGSPLTFYTGWQPIWMGPAFSGAMLTSQGVALKVKSAQRSRVVLQASDNGKTWSYVDDIEVPPGESLIYPAQGGRHKLFRFKVSP